MSDTSAAQVPPAASRWDTFLAPAAAAFALSALLAAWGTFGEDGSNVGEYLVVLVIVLVAIGIVFGVVIPRALSGANAARTAVILSVLGVLTVAVFWSGLPPVLAIGGIVLARSAGSSRMARAGLAVGVVALVADLAVYIGDQLG